MTALFEGHSMYLKKLGMGKSVGFPSIYVSLWVFTLQM